MNRQIFQRVTLNFYIHTGKKMSQIDPTLTLPGLSHHHATISRS